jgi:MerR family redox-sensitive transcriptional activator SoxR
MTIGELAKQAGLRASAIRYYEQIGILLPAQRVSGQRRYDTTGLYRLAVVQRARQSGFTLDEIRKLFFGFRQAAPAAQRWKTLSRQKLVELDVLVAQIKTMQGLLQKMMQNCRCETLDECGKGILQRRRGDGGNVSAKSKPSAHSVRPPAGDSGLRKRQATYNMRRPAKRLAMKHHRCLILARRRHAHRSA